MNQEETQENESFLKWIKSPAFQLSSHEQRTNDLELYMIAKNHEIYDLKAALSNSNDIRLAFDEFIEKTEFVQLNEYGLFRGCLGMHRADAMRHVIKSQQTKIKELEAALASKQEDIKQGLDDIQLSMSMFANKEDYLKAVKEQEHIDSNQPKSIEPEIEGNGSGISCPPCSQSEKVGRIEPAQDNEGLITFNDGGRPVLHHCFVDVKLSDGSFRYKVIASSLGWRWVDGCVNIIAYRIAK